MRSEGGEAATIEAKRDLSERLTKRIRPGMIAETFVYGALAVGVTESVRKKSVVPIATAGVGLVLGATAATINSVINHREAVHRSPRLVPRAYDAGRFLQSALVGLRDDRSGPEHKIHHGHADTPKDPYSPVNEGYWGVFLHISGLVKKYDQEHHADVLHHTDSHTTRRWHDKGLITAAGILGTHLVVGKVFGLPVKSSVVSAGIHVSTVYIQDATLTADAHMHGHAEDVGLTPLTSIVMGGEDGHGHHHHEPLDPRHATVDPGWWAIRMLEKFGLAHPHPTDAAHWQQSTSV